MHKNYIQQTVHRFLKESDLNSIDKSYPCDLMAQNAAERKTRFTSKFFMRKIEETVEALGFQVERKNNKVCILSESWNPQRGLKV